MAKKPSRYVDPEADLDNNNLPIESFGKVDPKYLPNFKANNSYNESHPSQGDTGSASYVGEQYTPNKYDDPNVYESDIPNLEDERASNQGTVSALGDATAKFVGKTVLSTVGNLAGTVYGVADAVAKGDVTKIWDNSFMDAVDAGNKKLDNIFQVYKNSNYQDANFLQRLYLHPTQFIDEATDTASFMAGAILSEIATSGLGSETIVPRALKYMKYLSEGAEATEATKALTSLATKGITLAGDLGTSIKHLAMGASYEGIVEARQATMQLREKMEEDYSKEHPGEDMPQNVKDDIDDRLSQAGVFTYLSNLALVGGTNLLLFPKLFGLGHTTAKMAEGKIVKDAETGLYKAAKESHSLLGNIATGLTKPIEESTKFGVQGTVSQTAKEFWDRKNDPEAKNTVNDLIDTFGKQLLNTYTSKEGWNNIGMGMIIGALGAPGRGILSPLGENHPLGKYGYKDVLDENGNKVGSEKLPLWTGGIKGSFDEKREEEARIGKVLNDLNQNTNFFKAAKANYDALVENNSIQKDQDKALKDRDIFNFQNAKDDQIHSYVSSRIKNNLYDDLLDEVSKIKKLSPDEFYTNFKGEAAADKASNIEKIKFQLETTQQFLDKAKNTRDAIKISDDVYRGDNEDLRDHLTHSIAAAKNLDVREKLMNQSIADLSDGMLSNMNLRTSGATVPAIMEHLQEVNPTAYALNKDKIQQLLEDSQKLREKRQDYLDVYNHLFTQEGQRQFVQAQKIITDAIQKEAEVKQKEEQDKSAEDIKKENIKETLKKAQMREYVDPIDENTGDAITPNSVGMTMDDLDDNSNPVTEGTKGPVESNNTLEPVDNTPNKDNASTGLETIPREDHLDPEETAVVAIEKNKEDRNESLITRDKGLVVNEKPEKYEDTSRQIKLINTDIQRTIGNVISYLGVDKIERAVFDKEDNTVKTRTYDIFDSEGNIEINRFVDTKLFSQNHYTLGEQLEIFVPTFDEMDERGLQSYNNTEYQIKIDSLEEYPIAIRNVDKKIIGYIPTQKNIRDRVAPEFVEQALKDNLTLRNTINEDRNAVYKSTITSKSPGFVIADKYEVQKSLFEALGNSKDKVADKVKLAIVKAPKGSIVDVKYLRTDESDRPFRDGEIINSRSLSNGVVYAILPSSAKEKYIVYPMNTNTIGENNAKTVVEAIKLFALRENLSKEERQSIDNIGDFNIKDFKGLNDFVNKIMYASSKANAKDNTIFKLFKDNLYLGGFDEHKFRLEDIATSQKVRDEIADILSKRYFSVNLNGLNENKPYMSYHLNSDTNIIEEKNNSNYQTYLNDQKVLTSNVRGVHIDGNEYAFTAQPVIGISNSISKDTKLITGEKKESGIEDAKILEETPAEAEEKESKETEKPIRKTKKILPIDPNKLKNKPLEDINPTFINKYNESEVNALPKIVKTLALPKIDYLFKNQFLKGNKDKFYKEVTELGAGKEQTQILKDWINKNNPTTIEDLKIGIAAELSYTIEINTSRQIPIGRQENEHGIDMLADFMDEETVRRIRGNPDNIGREINSQYYSYLTVPGGTNYTENEISTPQIEPSIKGHAQFSTRNGIGWFRSDKKVEGGEFIQGVPSEYGTSEHYGGNLTKTRRVLEVQSDLFQKGRDRDVLTEDQRDHQYAESADEAERLENQGYEFSGSTEDGLPSFTKLNKKNQFLQLLNKDNNWISFFVKSIIQDSVKKGYEEVHFPTGDTASKVEGHTTLEEHKANIQKNLDEANKYLGKLLEYKNLDISKHDLGNDKIKYYYSEKYDFDETANSREELLEKLNKRLKSQYNKVENWQRQLNDIETEGFAKLKPVYHFYENVIQSILKKNYSIERVKDEHNNEWFKVKLDSIAHANTIYFDINPNKSVLDQLFVDIDKFSDSQQRSIVKSIAYQLEEGKKEGYSTVDDLFDYAKDVFANTKEYFSDLNDDRSLDQSVQKFQDIEDNWDRFREKVLDHLKGIGIKVTKVFDDSITKDTEATSETPNLEGQDTESPEDTFVATEADYQRDNYSDQFSQSVSSKDTASAHLKLKLSFIPEVELIGNRLEPATNFLTMTEFMSLDKVWTSLQEVLTGLPVDQIYPTIQELAKTNPMYSTILSNIMDDPNTSIQNEFVVAFSKQQLKPLTVKIGYADSMNRRTINVFGTNRQGANNILIDRWYDRFKQSPLVKDDGVGNLIIDVNRARQAQASFNKFMSSYNEKDLNTSVNLQRGLSLIGINLSLATTDNLIKNGTKIDGIKYSAKEFLNEYVSLIFNRIAGGFTDPEQIMIGDIESDTTDSKLALNNPFISETRALNALAKLENITNPFLYESSYVGGDGKPRYSISNNSYISKFFNSLGDEERGLNRISDILSTSYSANSVWGDKFKSNAKFRETFKYHPFDSLGTNESKVTNKVFSTMSTKEKEYTRMSLFQNTGKDTSLFMAPIPSDKTTLPIIQVQKTKVVVDVDNLRIRNSEAINALYTPFISEYNRIREIQSQQVNPKFKDRLIEGYHNGMGEKFLIYDFLNNNRELFDDNEQLKLVDPDTLRKIVTPEIEKFSTDLIKKQIKYWSKLGLDTNKVFDKSYKRKLGDFGEFDIQKDITISKEEKAKLLQNSNKVALRTFAADYAINQFLAHFNYTQLISGDPALHGKGTVEKTWINYSKRLAKDIAPGLDGNFTNPNFSTIFLKDLKYTSKQFNEYQEVLKEKANAYKDINPADAQEYTTLKEHLAVMDAYGKLTPLLRDAGERLMKGSEDPYDIDLILQPMKPVYVGTMVDREMGINRMYYIKTSAFPLIPSLTKGLEVDKLRVAMEDNSIDRAVYESGVKLGLGTITQNVQSESGEVNQLDLKDKGVILDRDGFRIQQEVPYHGNTEKTTNEGSQGRKLILSDLDDDDQIDTLGTSMSGQSAKQIYESLHVEKMDRAFNKLLTDIGVDKNTNKIKDLSKLQKILLDEATNRNYNINDIYGLQIEKDSKGNQRFTIPLGFNNSSNRLESILNSLFTNRVIKSELPGFSKIQGSSSGFSKLRTIDQLNSQAKDSIIWIDSKDTDLNYIRKNSDGTKLLQADILVPSWFTDNKGNDIDLTKFIKEDGTLDTDKLPESLLTTIGLRIPTQGLNSMMSFKVKGFLPKMVGDLAIVPPEIVAQMGSDFDVDKLFMYRYHHTFDGERFAKVEPPQVTSKSSIDEEGNLVGDTTMNDFSKYSNEELDNSIIQMFQDRYEDVNLLSKILEPNGFGDLPKLSEEISKLIGTDKLGNFFTTESQNTIHKNNNDGKMGTAIFSLFSTFIKSAQDAKLRLNAPIIFKVEDRLIREERLFSKGHVIGKTPSTIISYFQSASVDNSKEQILGSLNINSETMDVAGTIALAGFDENYISYFLSQPIIREYVEALSNANDITNPEYNVNKELDAKNKVEEKYKLESAEDQAAYIMNLKQDISPDGIWFGLDNMREELENPTNLNQRVLLNNYLKIKEQTKSIRLVQNAISTDTSGLGIRYVDLQIRASNILIAKSMDAIVNVDKLFEKNTQIGKASDILFNALNIYKQILPYSTPAYEHTTSRILEYMGKADKASLYAEDLNSIYSSVKSFLYSTKSLLDIQDVNAERNRLIYGTEALGNRWEAYTQTPAGKKNLLSERIQVRRGDKITEPIRLQAINTPAANNSDNNEAMASYYRMYHKGNEVEKQLAKDLVNYFILTGAKQGANSIAKYIPYDILEAHDFSSKLHGIDDALRSDRSGNILEHSTEQFFQHNPNKAIAFAKESKDISNFKNEGFTLSPDSQYLIPNGEGDLTPPTYMSIYNSKIKNFMLYKIVKSTVLGSEYSRIDLLGDKYISEYNANDTTQYSIIKTNSSNIAIPEDINKTITEAKDDTTQVPDKSVQATEINKEYLTSKLNLDNTNVDTTLDSIINSSNLEYSNIAKDLKGVLVNYPNLSIDTNLDRRGISGQYSDNKVSINLDNILNSKNPLETAQRVILHEFLHAITANKIANYDKLSDEDKKKVDKIKILYNQYVSSIGRTSDGIRFKQLTAKFKEDSKSLTNEETQFLIDNKQQYYALDNINDFVAAGLTDETFVQQLKDNNWWNKIWTAITNLLGLNESYKNDYDALYNTTLDLGGRDKLTEENKNTIDSVDKSKIRNYSGDAKGSDQEWAKIGKEFGIPTTNYLVSHIDSLTQAQAKEVEEAYTQAAIDLGRSKIDKNTYSGKLVRRDYLQAKAADEIIAIGSIVNPGDTNSKGYKVKSKTQSIDGGTGYAVQMALNLKKDVYIFNQRDNSWYKSQYLQDIFGRGNFDKFIKTEIPIIKGEFAGIGTRELTSSGKQAIKDVYTKSFGSLEDINPNPRDQKAEFLSKYHLWDGKPMTSPMFDRVNASMKANDKYNNIKLDLAWENGQRVLRVFTKTGTPLYDINPEVVIPKTKEEKIIDKSIKHLYDIRNRYKSNNTYSKNVGLQAKVQYIESEIKRIQEENTVNIITNQAKDRIAAIQNLMDRPGLMSAYDIIDAQLHLSWFKNIRDVINYNEAFEDENKNLDEISRKSTSMLKDLLVKETESLANFVGQELNIKVNVKDLFNTPNTEVGHLESIFQSGHYSTNQKLQIMEDLIRKSKLKMADNFNHYQKEWKDTFNEFQKKHNNYNLVLQLNKEGKPTGYLLNKFKQDYYDELIKRKGNPLSQAQFHRENTKTEITEEDKQRFDEDVEALKLQHPEYNVEGSHDKAIFTQWIAAHNPHTYLAKIKRRDRISKEERLKYQNYVTNSPSDKWIDPRYKELKKFGDDSIEMKVYNELDNQFRAMAKKAGNQANYIPETTKEWQDKMFTGNIKGMFGKLGKDFQDAISIKLTSRVNSNLVDVDGVPIDNIPVYGQSNILNPEEKSYDLGRVLLSSKLQDIMLEHKTYLEPYLNFAKQLIQEKSSYKLNELGQPLLDENNKPLETTSTGRTPNLMGQAAFIPESFLYDKNSNQMGASKNLLINREHLNSNGEIVKETRAVTGSKVVDFIGNFTRLKTLGLNPVSSIGRIIWGTLSTIIFAGDRKSYGEREAFKSFSAILQGSIPGTAEHTKIKALAEYFDMRVQLGELKFGKLAVKSTTNPMANFSPYIAVNKSEDFIQHQTGIAVLMRQKITDLSGKERDLYDAFDNKGEWNIKEFGENPYNNSNVRASMVSYIQDVIQNVHGDYAGDTQINKNYIIKALLVMRRWLPQTMAARFGKEYTDLQGNIEKGRYRSYRVGHLNPLNLIKDMYKAFTTDASHDTIDTRNLRMNAYELAFIPILWGVTLALKGMMHGLYHDDDKEKLALTYLLNSLTRVSGDLTFFMNPYSFEATIREPIPAFKSIMDIMDIAPAVKEQLMGNGVYKSGIHKGQNKIGVKVRKAIPIVNRPEQIISAGENLLDKTK